MKVERWNQASSLSMKHNLKATEGHISGYSSPRLHFCLGKKKIKLAFPSFAPSDLNRFSLHIFLKPSFHRSQFPLMHNIAKLVTSLLQSCSFYSYDLFLAWNSQHLVLVQSYFLLLKWNFVHLSALGQKNLLSKIIRLCFMGNSWTVKPCM